MYEENQNSPKFVRGEEVEVSDDERFINPHPWKYVCTINHEYKYLVEVNCGIPTWWKCIRKLPKQEAWPKVFYIEKDVDDFVKGYSVPQRSIIQAAAIKDFLKSKNLLDFDEE